MPKMHLTTNLARQEPPPKKGKKQLFDTTLSGLMLEIRPSGGRTFYIRYQDAAYKTRQRRLGKAQELTVAQARKKAQSLLAQIRLGQDPDASSTARPQAPSVREFAETAYLPHARHAKRSARTDAGFIENHVLPALGDRALDEVTPTDIAQLVQGYREQHTPAGANRLLALCRVIFKIALQQEVPGLERNPAEGIRPYQENNQRNRFLTLEETQRLMRELERSHNRDLPQIVLMLLLTGARRSEVLCARWEHIDLERRQWYIPHSKSGLARYVPISEALVEVLRQLPSLGQSGYIFPSPQTGRPYSDIFRPWNAARCRAGMPEVRLHDLRHSFASFLVNQGHSLYEVQKLLGHSQITTTQRYAHLSNERLLEASNDVAKVLESATSGYSNEEEETQ